MACILFPECNFLHGYFRCQLPMETVDMGVTVKTVQHIHMFRRDRTSQVIKCNPWSTRLHPYPSLVQKMRTYLELERSTRRAPTKPATKKMPLGGKQPHKHISHKTLRQKTITGGIKKLHRYHPGLLAL